MHLELRLFTFWTALFDATARSSTTHTRAGDFHERLRKTGFVRSHTAILEFASCRNAREQPRT
jgi:hypothetical protein